LPAPKTFKVVEVVHGTGSAAHSHYHLAGEEDHDHDHEESEEELLHDYEVGAVTEMADIVRWLPKIAGDSDLDEQSWKDVAACSKKLEELVSSKLGDLDGEEEKRTAYQPISAESANHILELEKAAAVESEVQDQPKVQTKGQP
jgi:hypothetical protein